MEPLTFNNNKSTHKKLIEALLCSNQLFQSRGVNSSDIDSAVDPIISRSQIVKKRDYITQANIELGEFREKLEIKKIESTTNVNIPPFMKRKYQKDFSPKDPSVYTEEEKVQFQSFIDDKMKIMKESSIRMIEGDIEDTIKSIAKAHKDIGIAERVYSQDISSDIIVKKLYIMIRSYFAAVVILPGFDINITDNFSMVNNFSNIVMVDNVFVINNYPYKLSELELIQKQLCANIDELSTNASRIYSTESIQRRIVKYTKITQA
jgi:hypothetical protein